MKIVNMGSTLRIFPDDLKVTDTIPVGTYDIEFNPMGGYSLERRKDFVHDGKVYGDHMMLVDKILDRYSHSTDNFGTILGGRKGTGKSMMARIISERLREQGIPTIIVSENTPGLPKFLQSIEQPVFIFMDEFEKIFKDGSHDTEDEQSQFLSVFDGLNNNGHFYLITINDYKRINDYFLGRTGRFYYDIRFDTISLEEISQILSDNLHTTDDVDRMASLMYRLNVNYDQLKTIVNELNLGESIDNILKYLNLGLKHESRYRTFTVTVTLSHGLKHTRVMDVDTLYPEIRMNVDEEFIRNPKNISYDFNLRIPTEAFIFDDVVPKIDMSKVQYEHDYHTDVEDTDECIYKLGEGNVKNITLTPYSTEKVLAY